MQSARALIAIAALCLAAAAGATPIDSVGDTFTVQFDGNVGGDDAPGLRALATVSVASFDAAGGRVVLDIALRNTSDASLWQSSRVSALGFDVNGDIRSASASGLFSFALLGGKLPNAFGPVDVCAVDNRNSCSGGRNGGLRLGESGGLRLTLTFVGPIGELDLTNFGVRYQSLASEELGFCGDSGTGHGTVPEPGLLALFALASAALAPRLLGRRG